MQTKVRVWVGFFCFVFLSSVSTSWGESQTFLGLDIRGWDKEILAENEFLSGDFEYQRTTAGKRCANDRQFLLTGLAELEALDLVVLSESELEVTADLLKPQARVKGRVSSDDTYCLGVKLKTSASAESLKVKVLVSSSSQDLSDLSLKVQQTQFGQIHLAKPLPTFYEELLTELVNVGLEKLWVSRLGDAINAKISEAIRKKVEG